MRGSGVASFMLLSGAVLGGPAAAQQGLTSQVYACASIEDAAARHSCFDALVPELRKAGQSADGQAVPTAPAAQSPLTAPVLSADAKAEAKTRRNATPEKAIFTVTTITTGSDGKYRFAMENGQIWRQLDSIRLRNLGDGPWRAEIRKAALGSFLLTVGKSAAIRVERVN